MPENTAIVGTQDDVDSFLALQKDFELLYEGNVYPLGEWFGGFSITSVALDPDSNGIAELYFTYSWGSGLHRSLAGYFDPATKHANSFDYAHMNGDMALMPNRDGSLSLYAAKITSMAGFINFTTERTDFIADIVYAKGQISLNPAMNE
ncbi:hypothetical protein [Paenibacillus sp. LPE1-1-1.1]|uniref:hypothetical protein n=1 Tax=Paenibacillus sp. LPE1-1-1.1 TaxID=3135230 RepID=UPI00342A5CB6